MWCIVELGAAAVLNKPIVVKGGVAKKEEGSDGWSYDTFGMKEMLNNLTHMIDSEASECANRADFDREMETIRTTLKGGVARLNELVVGVLEGAHHSVSANVPEVDAFGETKNSSSASLSSSSSKWICNL